MIEVVSDIEANQFVVLSIFMLNEREDQAAELLIGPLNLKRFLSTELQP